MNDWPAWNEYEQIPSLEQIEQIHDLHNAVYRVGQKTYNFTLVYIFTNYWPIFKIFHWHALQTICDNVFIIDPTTP